MIKLTRVVERSLSDRDYTACATFEDLDGKVLSVAFEGRYKTEEYGNNWTYFGYTKNTDCPVIDDQNQQHQMVGDMQAMRAMRDSLNRMNLGD